MEKKKAAVKGTAVKRITSCEDCALYTYDEEYEYYICGANLDEDEMSAFMRNAEFACPYYQNGDEYRIVRKQL